MLNMLSTYSNDENINGLLIVMKKCKHHILYDIDILKLRNLQAKISLNLRISRNNICCVYP